MSNRTLIVLFITTLLASVSTMAFAYLDPATGSILLQGLLAGLAGGLLAVKLFFSKIKSFFGGDKKELAAEEEIVSSNESQQKPED